MTTILSNPFSVTVVPISMAVKRYDGGSGEANFNGGIPLQAGQLNEADIGNVSIWDGATELPIYVNALNGTHSDGSLKAIQVQCTITINDANAKALTLKIDTAATLSVASPDTIDYNWCESPRMLYCTSPAHMCASRIAPMPLVPMSTLPADWQNFLTTEADGWFDRVTQGYNASYNWGYGWCCRYLMTGDPEPLRVALREIVKTSPNKYSPGLGSYTLATNQTNYTQDEDPGNAAYFNPDNYPNTSGFGLTGEQYDGTADFFLMYYLAGWEHARRCLVLQGAHEASEVNGTITTNMRFEMRRQFMQTMLSYIMQNDVQVGSSPGGWSYNAMSFTPPWDKIANLKTASEAIDPGHFTYGIWGANADVNNIASGAPATGIQPTFQYELMLPSLMTYYLNIEQRADIPNALVDIADYVISQFDGPFTDGQGTYYVEPVYWEQDPANVSGDNSDNKAYPYMLFPVIAYAYAHTGDSKYTDIIDIIVAQNVSGQGGMGGEIPHGKNMGQVWCYAYHAAAYRAGVSSTGWS